MLYDWLLLINLKSIKESFIWSFISGLPTTSTRDIANTAAHIKQMLWVLYSNFFSLPVHNAGSGGVELASSNCKW